MSVPYPIYRCVSVDEKARLARDLHEMGFCGKCLAANEVMNFIGHDLDRSYMRVTGSCLASDSTPMIDNQPVNSPKQMIAYIKRHNLMPKAAPDRRAPEAVVPPEIAANPF
jgi:hypothetical protein